MGIFVMADRDIVNPDSSSYSLAKPSAANVGNVPFMDMQRTLPRQMSTGALRGTQTIGATGGIQLDNSNSRITVSDPNGSNIRVLIGFQENGF